MPSTPALCGSICLRKLSLHIRQLPASHADNGLLWEAIPGMRAVSSEESKGKCEPWSLHTETAPLAQY